MLIVKNLAGLKEDSKVNKLSETYHHGKKETIVIKSEKLVFSAKPPTEFSDKDKLCKSLSDVILENTQKTAQNEVEPITLPFTSKYDKEKTFEIEKNSDFFELKEDEPFLIQFPRILPFDIPKQKEIKDLELKEDFSHENSNEQENFYENKFENSFNFLDDDMELGKLRIYDSGRMEIQMGDVVFDVSQGTKNSFFQELLLQEGDNAYFLGNLKSEKLIATPRIEEDEL